jgi:hypothetical protein
LKELKKTGTLIPDEIFLETQWFSERGVGDGTWWNIFTIT